MESSAYTLKKVSTRDKLIFRYIFPLLEVLVCCVNREKPPKARDTDLSKAKYILLFRPLHVEVRIQQENGERNG